MDVGGHYKEHGKTEEKWEAMRKRIISSDLTPGHRKLLQEGTNAGLTPSANTLKRWVAEWVKDFVAFDKNVEEGKQSSTGNSSDIDDFLLGRDSYDCLFTMRDQAKQADADNQKKKAKKAEDEMIGPTIRNRALERFKDKTTIPERPSKTRRIARENRENRERERDSADRSADEEPGVSEEDSAGSAHSAHSPDKSHGKVAKSHASSGPRLLEVS